MPAKKISPSEPLIDELIKHNVALEKVSLELLESMNKMTRRMDRMLSLFEEAAKNIERAEKLDEKPLAKQISDLVEQNKTIARGLILIERFVRDKTTIGFNPTNLQSKPLSKTELE
ncbi:hypothetical protein HOG54_00375 [Candidatus Woesearchaeota archaeon]|nr:hypothetical protein [Candidatus Woesearchaeota archaeon]